MPTISVYLTKQNYIEIGNEENVSNYINRLIEADKISNNPADSRNFPTISEDGTVTPPKKVTAESLKPKETHEDNPYLCKECNQPKVSGKCINKECKLKGRIQ